MGFHDRDWYRNSNKKSKYRDMKYDRFDQGISRIYKYSLISICSLAIAFYLILYFWPAGSEFLRNMAMKFEIFKSDRLSSLLDQDHDVEFSNYQPENMVFVWNDSNVIRANLDSGLNSIVSSSSHDPIVITAHVPIDFVAADIIRSHFGAFAKELLSALDEVPQHSIAREKLEQVQQSLLSKHGIRFDGHQYGPDYGWLVDKCLPYIRPVAIEIVNACNKYQSNGIDRLDILSLISFVQGALGYNTVNDWHDLRPPMSVLTEREGDCDSRTILLISLIRSIDNQIPLAVIIGDTPEGPHAVAGIGLQQRRNDFVTTHEGIKYVLVETTGQWGIGDLGSNGEFTDLVVHPID